MDVDHGGEGAGGQVPPDFVMFQNFKHQLRALQCRKMCFLPLQQDFIVSPAMRPPEFQNSSQIYAYGSIPSYHVFCAYPVKSFSI